MSVLFDLKQKTSYQLNHNPSAQGDSKLGLRESVAKAIFDGEIEYAQQRCVRTWTEQTGLSADQAPAAFMEPCKASQIALMRVVGELKRNAFF